MLLRRLIRWAVAAVALVAGILAFASPVAAQTDFDSSTPADGDVVDDFVDEVLAGALMAVFVLDSPGELFSTEWGQVLLLKSAAVAIAASGGAYNPFCLRPRFEAAPDDPRLAADFRSTLIAEAIVLTFVVITTAWLAPPPPDRHQSLRGTSPACRTGAPRGSQSSSSTPIGQPTPVECTGQYPFGFLARLTTSTAQ